MKNLIFVLMLCIFPVFGNPNVENDYPSRIEFESLDIEEQFNIYLSLPPLSDDFYGFPLEDIYFSSIISSNDRYDVFNLSKHYANLVSFEYLNWGLNNKLKDYRFSLLLSLFYEFSSTYKLNSEEKEWLINYYRNHLITYLKREKRIDINTVDVSIYIDYILVDENQRPEEENIGKYIYIKYIVEENVVVPEEVSIDYEYIFPGYNGKIIQ